MVITAINDLHQCQKKKQCGFKAWLHSVHVMTSVVHCILITSSNLLTTQCCTMQQVPPCFTVNFIEPNKGSAFTPLQTVIKRQQWAGEGRLWVMVPSCIENTDTLQPTNSICLNLDAFGFALPHSDEDWKKTSPQAWAVAGVMEFNLAGCKLCNFPLYLRTTRCFSVAILHNCD